MTSRGGDVGIAVEVVDGVDDLAAMAPRWDDLAERSVPTSVFARPDWVLPWFHACAPRMVPRGIFVTEGRQPVGAALFASDVAGREWHPAGEPLHDRFVVLAVPGATEPTRRAVADLLRSTCAAGQVIRVRHADTERGGLLPEHLGAGVRTTGYTVEDAPILELPASFPAYLASLPRTRRVRLLYERRRCERELGARFVAHTAPADVAAGARDLLELRRASWSQRGGLARLAPVTLDPSFDRLLTTAARSLAARGRSAVLELRDRNRLVASVLLLADEDARMLLYTRAFAPADARLSPGNVLDGLVVEWLIARGTRVLDLGRGGEPYKFRLGARSRLLANYDVAAAGTGP